MKTNLITVLRSRLLILASAAALLYSSQAVAQMSETSISTIERAMTDELARSKNELKLKGLVNPFFISYTVTDETKLEIQATNGSLIRSNDHHTRTENVRLLINDYQLDDENFSDNSSMFGGGAPSPETSLPLDDDYLAIRRTLWLSTDDLFKQSNELFTKKKAALASKQLSDEVKNLPDFSHATKAEIIQPPATKSFDRSTMEKLARDISRVFTTYPDIQTSNVSLKVTNDYEIARNTEGSHIRKPTTLAIVRVVATAQAIEDGEPLVLSFNYAEADPGSWPNQAAIIQRTTELAESMKALVHANRFSEKTYTGPILFEGDAARDLLLTNIVARLSAHREDALGGADVTQLLGGLRRSSLKDRLKTRILPVTISIWDDPTYQVSGKKLIGSYAADEEAVVPEAPLKLIDNGILSTLYMTRTPTKEVRETNGHARSEEGVPSGSSENEPGPGVVIVKDSKALAKDTLRQRLFQYAKDDGYNYAIVCRSLGTVSDLASNPDFGFTDILSRAKAIQPALLYKVFRDGHEELLRGAQITYPTPRDLREIATSQDTMIYNTLAPASGGLFSIVATIPMTLIGPSQILSPELEIERRDMKATPTVAVVARPKE
jgi:TldD protein